MATWPRYSGWGGGVGARAAQVPRRVTRGRPGGGGLGSDHAFDQNSSASETAPKAHGPWGVGIGGHGG